MTQNVVFLILSYPSFDKIRRRFLDGGFFYGGLYCRSEIFFVIISAVYHLSHLTSVHKIEDSNPCQMEATFQYNSLSSIYVTFVKKLWSRAYFRQTQLLCSKKLHHLAKISDKLRCYVELDSVVEEKTY